MIYCDIHIDKYDWDLYCFFAVDGYYLDDIMEQLWKVGCDGNNAKRAYDNIKANDLNTGLCYSNPKLRSSVIVTAITSNASEFAHSFVHEISHCAVHIAQANNIDLKSEEFCYLTGDLAKTLFPFVSDLLCDCCRTKKHYKNDRRY